MCSLSASPLPTPSVKRPSSSTADVAAACATIAGWMRTVGHVTAVVTCIRSVAWATSAPIIDHTNGLSPWASFHGWIVVGDPQPLEPGLLGEARLADELAWSELLAGQEVADAHARGLHRFAARAN